MIRRALLLLLLLLPCAVGLGEEGKAPLLIFREPDATTAREIENKLISQEGIGASKRKPRQDARRQLEEIGAWSVPYLQGAVERSVAERVPMNAIMVLARILDPVALPQIRKAANKSRHPFVRQTACLALGVFGQREDRALLGDRLKDRDYRRLHQRAAALGLAKLSRYNVGPYLTPMVTKLPADEHTAAAVILAATIALPGFDARKKLENRDVLVRRAATVALLARPIAAADAGPLLKRLRRSEDKRLREIQFRAIGAIKERTPEIRKLLLDCATKEKQHNKPARIAAAIGLASEWGVKDQYKPLRNAYRSHASRNDPLNGALLFALAHTLSPKPPKPPESDQDRKDPPKADKRQPDAVDDLLGVAKDGSEWLACYAVGSLLVYLADCEVSNDKADTILKDIDRSRMRTEDVILSDLLKLARKLSDLQADERRAAARAGLAKIPDPSNLHLWDRTEEGRRWEIVNNDFLPMIFELDALVDYGNPLSHAEEGPVVTHRARVVPPGEPAEQDLFDFLTEKPYFGPEDLAGEEGEAR